MDNEVRGISFPFRIGGRGGVVMSGESYGRPLHIEEGLRQLLGTTQWERVMNPVGIEPLDIFFNDLNETTKNMAIFKINEAIRVYEPRVTVREIQLHKEEQEDGSMAHIIELSYEVVDSGNSYTTRIPV